MNVEQLRANDDKNERSSLVVSSALQQGRRWFLVFTKSSSERIAELNLQRQGFGVYCPRLVKPVRKRGRWVDRVVALFPRYLFVQVDPLRQSLAPVRSTLGVSNLVCCGTEPVIVPQGLVQRLMEKADPISGLHQLAASRISRGATVSIVAGAFEGLNGIFERETGGDRVIVLLRLLGLDIPVRLESHCVALTTA